jgi:hypothetical protein
MVNSATAHFENTQIASESQQNVYNNTENIIQNSEESNELGVQKIRCKYLFFHAITATIKQTSQRIMNAIISQTIQADLLILTKQR